MQCGKFRRFGHKTDDCNIKSGNLSNNYNAPVTKTMRILSSNANAKFIKECRVNGISMKSFIDFSYVTLLTRLAMSHYLLVQRHHH